MDFVNNPIMTLLILGLIFLYKNELVKWLRKAYKTKLQPILETAVQEKDIITVPEEAAKPEVPRVQAVEVVTSQDDCLVASTDDNVNPSRERASSESGKLQVPETQEETPQLSPEKEKKKAHRGRRGGVKHRKGRANSQGPGTSLPPPDVDDAVRNAQKLGEQPAIEPDVRTLPNGVDEVSGPILRLNSLEVNTDKLIGTGSNGTMVFEGNFDGRNVAVKRMLIQFFDIASQETKLLRESDDHPNGNFLSTLAFLPYL
jgi:serine/threonine-protein kinase/endoribonuclease IRE1